jgi:hypothetical protein
MTRRTEFDALQAQVEQLERTAKAAREAPFDRDALLRGDFDDLAPARPLVWILVAIIVAAIAMILLPAHAHAAEGDLRGIVNVAAWHSRDTTTCDQPGITVPTSDRPGASLVTLGGSEVVELKTWTPGLGVGYDLTEDSMLAGGLWRNSQGKVVPYATIDWRPLRAGPVSLGLFGGLSAGYCGSNNGGPVPVAGATARLDIDRVAIHLLLARKPGDNSTAIGLSLSVSIE